MTGADDVSKLVGSDVNAPPESAVMFTVHQPESARRGHIERAANRTVRVRKWQM